MKDYSLHSAEDFATDPDFIRWVLGNRSEDGIFWAQWLLQYPDKQMLLEEARTLVRSVKIREEELDERDVRQGIADVLQETHRRAPILSFRWTYAATVAGLIAAGVLLYRHHSVRTETGGSIARVTTDLPPDSDSTKSVFNDGHQTMTVTLPDGSTIALQPGSVVRFSKNLSMAASRDIYLSGDATFRVAKMPNKPFEVFSHELVTQVLGTSFTIKAGKDETDFTVVVHSGKVSVYNRQAERDTVQANPNQRTGVILTPNQELIYARAQQKFQKILIDTPVMINPVVIKNDFLYEDTPVADVLEQLKKAFDIDIEYDKEVIGNCRISADLSDESIYRKLDLICKAMDAKYEMIDGVVSIQAHPCH